jgi:hypothetical protein
MRALAIGCAAFAALFAGGLELAAPPAARAGGQDGEAKAPAASVDDLVKDLGSDDFKTREAATDALGARGAEAVPALEKAAQSKDPEVRWRAEKALRAARERAAASPRRRDDAAPPPGRGERALERRTPEPRDPSEEPQGRAEERMRQLEENLRRMHPEIGDLLKDLRLQEVLPKEFGQIFEDMEERLRDLDRRDRPIPRDFWTFRYKDGRWQIERGDDPLAEKVGVRTQPVPPVARAQLALGDAPALALEEIKPGSIAARAGLARYDVVLSVDGKPCGGDADLEALARAGDHQIEFLRGGKRETASVSVEADRPAPPPAEPAPPPAAKGDDKKLRKY